jgi:L-glyceraldehyde reductase
VTKLPKTKARAVGVSNYSIKHVRVDLSLPMVKCPYLTDSSFQLEAIINATGVVPAVNQIERHPYLPNPPLIDYAKQKGIHITAYSVFTPLP